MLKGADEQSPNDGDMTVVHIYDHSTPGEIVEDDTSTSLQLDYNAGAISLSDSAGTPIFQATDTPNPLTVEHLFVSAADGNYAYWNICGMGKSAIGEKRQYDGN